MDINLNEYDANKTIESKWLLDHLGSLTFYVTYMPHIVYVTDRPDPLLNNTHTHNEQGTIGRLEAQVVQVELPYLIANLNESHIEEGSVLCQKIRIIGQLVIFL